MERHPHHIPLIFMLDVINGYRTVYPIPLAQGASFLPELSGKCAQMAARVKRRPQAFTSRFRR